MSTLIVAFPKIEEAKAVRSLLVRRGYDVAVPVQAVLRLSIRQIICQTEL